MKEKTLKNKIIKVLNSEGWVCWYPIRNRYRKVDIFSCYDLVCAGGSKRDEIKLIQFTTTSNAAARRRKIKNFLKENNLMINSELWSYDKRNKKWKIENIYPQLS